MSTVRIHVFVDAITFRAVRDAVYLSQMPISGMFSRFCISFCRGENHDLQYCKYFNMTHGKRVGANIAWLLSHVHQEKTERVLNFSRRR